MLQDARHYHCEASPLALWMGGGRGGKREFKILTKLAATKLAASTPLCPSHIMYNIDCGAVAMARG